MKGGMLPLGNFHGTLELSSDLIRKKVNSLEPSHTQLYE